MTRLSRCFIFKIRGQEPGSEESTSDIPESELLSPRCSSTVSGTVVTGAEFTCDSLDVSKLHSAATSITSEIFSFFSGISIFSESVLDSHNRLSFSSLTAFLFLFCKSIFDFVSITCKEIEITILLTFKKLKYRNKITVSYQRNKVNQSLHSVYKDT